MSKDLVTIYFSKDRPLQLQLAIETNNMHRKLHYVTYDDFVLYKKTTPDMGNSYKVLAKKFPEVNFIKETNFKENLLEIIDDYEHVLFVVDDTIFVRKYYFFDVKEAFCNPGVLGFSLRLGSNTTLCYPYNRDNDPPAIYPSENEYSYICRWTNVGFGDFAYPLEVSSSIYETYKVYGLLDNAQYSNPNELEYVMDIHKNLYREVAPFLAFYPLSRAFSAPVNKVQTVNKNRAGTKSEYTVEALKKMFNEGYKINSIPFVNFIPNGCHQEVEFEFIKEENIKGEQSED